MTTCLKNNKMFLFKKIVLGCLTIGDLQKFLTVCTRERPFVPGCEIALNGDPAYFGPVAFMRKKNKRICLWKLSSFGRVPDLCENEGPDAHWRRCKYFQTPDLSVPEDKIVKLQGNLVTMTVDDDFYHRGSGDSKYPPSLLSDCFDNKEVLIKLEQSPF